ncbi:hypothetical protein VNO77_20660 [Canavalia gladiata]|uniref:Uncharacterized protein n=1 Tax=Canavalia gladiata TaxID=3824 RepID=A0AAN9LPN0_CANGL
MPCLTLSTNVSLQSVDTSSLFSQLISTVANILARPQSYVTLAVPKSRFFLKFYDIEGYNCGLNGSIMVMDSK